MYLNFRNYLLNVSISLLLFSMAEILFQSNNLVGSFRNGTVVKESFSFCFFFYQLLLSASDYVYYIKAYLNEFSLRRLRTFIYHPVGIFSTFRIFIEKKPNCLILSNIIIMVIKCKWHILVFMQKTPYMVISTENSSEY